MTDKEFRRLGKSDLLDIIFELQKNEEKLRAEILDLREKLASKELKIQNAGSIAEAALAVNGVMEAAQAAADQYLAQLQTLRDNEIQKTRGEICEISADPTLLNDEDAEDADNEISNKYSRPQ